MEVAEVLATLRRGERVSDTRFDKLFSPALRKVSGKQWTEVEVALEAARFLAPGPESVVLDVGSGIGKFCLIGALATPARFVGIERREELWRDARSLARELKVERVRYLCGDATLADWSAYSGAYLFNPFQENVDLSASLDAETRPYRVSVGQYREFLARIDAKLRAAPAGFRVATYYGYGATMPPRYREEAALASELRLWVQT